jgi:hypothetical protein
MHYTEHEVEAMGEAVSRGDGQRTWRQGVLRISVRQPDARDGEVQG